MAPSLLADDSGGALPTPQSLKAPTSPAFVVLGVQPTAVEKPNTPMALGLSLLNRTDNLSTLPRDFAMEVSPYWLLDHSDVRLADDMKRSFLESIERTAAFSVASAEVGDSANPSTALSVGFRASLVSGGMSKETIKYINDIRSYANCVAKAKLDSSHLPSDQRDAFAESICAARRPERTWRREGIQWEIAGAGVWSFPDNVAKKGKFRGFGVWSTLKFEVSGREGLLVLRYLENDLFSTEPVLDWGLRLVLVDSDLFGLSVERVERYFIGDEDKDRQDRYAGLFEYRMKDNVWVDLSIGQDFESHDQGSLLAQLGVSFGLSPSPEVSAP